MKYLPLIWMGVWQKRARTALTLLSIVVAFLLFGLLQGVDSLIRGAIDSAGLDKIFVDSEATMMIGRFSDYQMLPASYAERIESIPGVTAIVPYTTFAAYYREPKNPVFGMATNEQHFRLNKEDTDMPKEYWDKLHKTRTGIAIGQGIVDQFGWKIGDRITLHSLQWPHPDGSSAWEFDVVGIFQSERFPQTTLINYDYLDQGRMPSARGLITRFNVQVDDPRKADGIAKAIDKMFINSDRPTSSQTELASMQFFLKSIGDIGFILHSVLGAVFATLLFLTVNTLMQSVRERIPQLAVLKTLGFSDTAALGMVLAECALICLVGGLLGLLLAAVAFPLLKDVVGLGRMPPIVFVWGVLVTLVMAILAGWLPAWRAKRLNIVDALAGR